MNESLNTTRLEAFSDAVIAVIITIMVLELHAPDSGTLEALRSVAPAFSIYLLSFINTGVYWNNHHHVIKAAKRVTAGIMWANLNLLFWISLIPFATAWLGDSGLKSWPVALYGTVLILAGFSFQILQRAIIADIGADSAFAKALGDDIKGKMSVILYALGIAASFWIPWVACGLYALVTLSWLLPDPRIERAFHATHE